MHKNIDNREIEYLGDGIVCTTKQSYFMQPLYVATV